MVKPKRLIDDDVFHILAEAVESYKLAAMRDRSGYISHGYTVETLIESFPKYFSKQSNGKAKFIGTSADQVLENYLEGLGYKCGSHKYYKLAQCVIDLATEEVEDVKSYIKETNVCSRFSQREERRGKNRYRNAGPIKYG